jgi:hypothetical protein
VRKTVLLTIVIAAVNAARVGLLITPRDAAALQGIGQLLGFIAVQIQSAAEGLFLFRLGGQTHVACDVKMVKNRRFEIPIDLNCSNNQKAGRKAAGLLA